ncbi:MAG: Gmad2 immunoglobulin-like domain-containing protein [Firmicutes bacterium]|nr:Gmad2 immunoglobulin-like domain-containing protein [Bacillota bacterium]
MKKMILSILITFFLAGLCSCSAPRKPVPQNRTFIVPEVSRVAFNTVDLKAAPKVVRDIAKVMENQDAATWAQSGGNTYLVVSQGELTRNYDVTVDEVLQRLPEPGFTWLDVKLKYKKSSTPRNPGEPFYTVVKADTTGQPNGVGFTTTGLETAAPPVRPIGRTAPTPPQNTQTGATIDQPSPNQEIRSPVRVRGTVRDQGQKRVRISTRGGQIIKEASLNLAPGTETFSIDIPYGSPQMATPGEITLISTGGGEERVLARVPVVIK